MAKRMEDAIAALESRAKRAGGTALETFRALDEHYALEASDLERLRKAAGVSQRQLAFKAKIDQGDLSKILSGKTDPRWSTVRRVVSTLRTFAAGLPSAASVGGKRRSPSKGKGLSSASHRKRAR